jgi:hypothetical protein
MVIWIPEEHNNADGVHAITFGEEARDFDYNQNAKNAKNTMSRIQNQDFLFRPFVSTALSMMSNGTS